MLRQAPPDWDRLSELAVRHGLQPLLFAHINQHFRNLLPRGVYAAWWSRQRQLEQRNQAMTQELRSILALLGEHSIPAVPYKGPVLAHDAYGVLALREFGDLDLLLRPEDIRTARKLLESLGYRAEFPLPPTLEDAFLRAREHYHLMLVCDARNLHVELHWRTDAQFQVEPADDPAWWQSLPVSDWPLPATRRFVDHELLLMLCLHGSKHRWERLAWLTDIAVWLHRHPAPDWAWMMERAATLCASRRFALALHLLRDVHRADLPAEVDQWLQQQGKARRIADVISHEWFEDEQEGAWHRLGANLQLYETAGQKIRHVVDVLFRPSLLEWSRWPLPRALYFLYAPLRIARLGRRQLDALLGRDA